MYDNKRVDTLLIKDMEVEISGALWANGLKRIKECSFNARLYGSKSFIVCISIKQSQAVFVYYLFPHCVIDAKQSKEPLALEML